MLAATSTDSSPGGLRLPSILRHPLTSSIIAIISLAAAIVFGVIAAMSRKAKEPMFAVSESELVAQTVDGEERLGIFWDGEQLQNVRSTKVAIWNNGRDCIDKNDLSVTNPIRIEPPEEAEILAVQVLRTSRSSLQFDTIVDTGRDSVDAIIIGIKGDEALDKFDGGIFHILYSSPGMPTWRVAGRIKGVPTGFRAAEWSRVYRERTDPFLLRMAWGAVLISCLLWMIFGVQQARGRRHPKGWSGVIMPLALPFVGFVAWLIQYYSRRGPPWLLW